MYFIYAVIYINNTAQPTSFMVKLVGISLVSLILLISITGAVYFRLNEKYYDLARMGNVQSVRNTIHTGDYSQIPESVQYVALRSGEKEFLAKHSTIWKKNPVISNAGLSKSNLVMAQILLRGLPQGNNLSKLKAQAQVSKGIYRSDIFFNKRSYRYSNIHYP